MTFKKGDKVKMLSECDGMCSTGDEAIITSVDTYDHVYPYEVNIMEEECWLWVTEDEIELITRGE